MRNAFAAELAAAAAADPRVVFLSGDIGNRLFDAYKARFPDRFFNCGVAEANMMGVAAGLALSGLRPIVYTIAPFVTSRCYEQIKLDVCYHAADVVIAGVGAGLSYAGLGATHHAFEDLAILRALPGLALVCPGDPHEVRAGLRAALARRGPTYLRLGIKGEPDVHERAPDFVIGRAIPLRAGERVAILATGNLLATAREAADLLARGGLSPELASVHTVKPLDGAHLARVFDEHELVVTVEEHSLVGGLGGAVAEWLADGAPRRARLLRIGLPDAFVHEAGGQRHARERAGLSAPAIAESIRRKLAEVERMR